MRAIHTERAPEPIGPYVQGYEANGMIHTSMQLPIDPDMPEKSYQDIAEEAGQLLANLLAVVRAGGGNIHTVIKTTVYITNLDNFAAVNNVYENAFGRHKPARSVVNVTALPKGYRVAMDAVAVIE